MIFLFLFPWAARAASEVEAKKSYIEDIFIWRMSDELKLSAEEEKKFTAIHKDLNKKKAELNKDIQELMAAAPKENTESNLKKLRQAIKSYNQISLDEFDSMKKLLGVKRFASYLQIKSELTSKVKSLLSGEKPPEEKEKKEAASPNLPPPQVILEK
jgi:hypothetical protein